MWYPGGCRWTCWPGWDGCVDPAVRLGILAGMPNRAAKAAIYQDSAGEWRWHIKAPNGRIVADSAEGYRDRRGARRGLDATIAAVAAGLSVQDRG